MPDQKDTNAGCSEEKLQELVSAADGGARTPVGSTMYFLTALALSWSLFQLLLASPIAPVVLPGDVINNSRQIHLAFALALAALTFPLAKSSSTTHVPWYDWALAFAGAFIALYGYFFYDKIVNNGGLADTSDTYFALVGIILLFIAAYRTLGPVMVALAFVFLLYVFFGSSNLVPEDIRWAGASLRKAMSHMWITSEGVFGIALGVSTKFVFLFVLFGALLDRAGAGNYFIKLAFGALGHLRGGPAKAAVMGSAATGLISGSSIANVVTTGTFTIPLMKRVGFSAEKAGSVEVASSVNGQIMPPVMGAAAFLMVEYIGISYLEVITHAFVPAVISYIALIYIVHLEAVKLNMPTLGGRTVSMGRTIGGVFAFFAGFALLCYGLQFPVGLITALVPEGANYVLMIALFVAYVGLVRLAAASPDLEPDDPHADVVEVPRVADVFKTGLHFILPILVLVYLLMIERKSPGLSAFWASMLLVVILLTQHPLKAYFRRSGRLRLTALRGVEELISGLLDGARNMIGIALATATAGLIVGTVSLTGIGQVMAEFVEFLSGGNLIAMLICVAVLSLILGMGLPTTANYIVVSSLMVPVIVELSGQSGLLVPLIAAHLFVFYFGIMADVTPPVGLASFAAAAVSGGDAIRTGITAFFYSLRTVALPFVFIFNTDILLIEVTWMQGIVIFIASTVGILIFTAATMGWFITKSRTWETVALLLVALAIFRPGAFMDRVQPPFTKVEVAALEKTLSDEAPGTQIQLSLEGPDFNSGEIRQALLPLMVPEGNDRLDAVGLLLREPGVLDEPAFGTALSDQLSSFDFYADTPVHVTGLSVEADQLPKEIIWLPAMILLLVVAGFQKARASKEALEKMIQ